MSLRADVINNLNHSTVSKRFGWWQMTNRTLSHFHLNKPRSMIVSRYLTAVPSLTCDPQNRKPFQPNKKASASFSLSLRIPLPVLWAPTPIHSPPSTSTQNLIEGQTKSQMNFLVGWKATWHWGIGIRQAFIWNMNNCSRSFILSSRPIEETIFAVINFCFTNFSPAVNLVKSALELCRIGFRCMYCHDSEGRNLFLCYWAIVDMVSYSSPDKYLAQWLLALWTLGNRFGVLLMPHWKALGTH